jgi:hypothetical protein
MAEGGAADRRIMVAGMDAVAGRAIRRGWVLVRLTMKACRIRLATTSINRAFLSEVDTGSREENASKQESRVQSMIGSNQSEPIML